MFQELQPIIKTSEVQPQPVDQTPPELTSEQKAQQVYAMADLRRQMLARGLAPKLNRHQRRAAAKKK